MGRHKPANVVGWHGAVLICADGPNRMPSRPASL